MSNQESSGKDLGDPSSLDFLLDRFRRTQLISSSTQTEHPVLNSVGIQLQACSSAISSSSNFNPFIVRDNGALDHFIPPIPALIPDIFFDNCWISHNLYDDGHWTQPIIGIPFGGASRDNFGGPQSWSTGFWTMDTPSPFPQQETENHYQRVAVLQQTGQQQPLGQSQDFNPNNNGGPEEAIFQPTPKEGPGPSSEITEVVPPILPTEVRPDDYFTYLKHPFNLHFERCQFFIEGSSRYGVIYPKSKYFKVKIRHPSGKQCSVPIEIKRDRYIQSRYICTFMTLESGVYNGSVQLKDDKGNLQNVYGSPFKISVSRNYNFSHSGNRMILKLNPQDEIDTWKEPIKFWGIDADIFTNRIFIADKDAHQIRIISSEGLKIGAFGTGPGLQDDQFNRPTGVAVDLNNTRLIISDKDNHRICIWSLDGQFIKTFGKFGVADGEFNYPWGVAVSPDGDLIAVADSRNHRIQMFDGAGNFLKKYFKPRATNEGRDVIKITNPRGVCFDNEGKHIFVTDFNQHAVFKFNIDLTEIKTIVPPGILIKPQGITIDIAGNLAIADSWNNCVRVISPEGTHVKNLPFGGKGYKLPQDITTLTGGQLVILDGNGRLFIY